MTDGRMDKMGSDALAAAGQQGFYGAWSSSLFYLEEKVMPAARFPSSNCRRQEQSAEDVHIRRGAAVPERQESGCRGGLLQS